MRSLCSLAALPLLLAGLTGCATTAPTDATASNGSVESTIPETVEKDENPDGDVAVITAKGMSCPLCASNADRQLMRLPGVKWVNIDLGTGDVKVGVDQNHRPTNDQLTNAIDEAGFTAGGVTWQEGQVK